ncbi:hypothetical protein MUK42_08574 [Musa troglodytarum]|uniref:Uncharacterized protein n=1 Tax=Musa troglodytarum TaxID=320322 RepID=A0A9E7EAI8_9LILI|nr:hypothetical protein MUK42_08574 [Musa troglodytarum]
MLSSSSIMQPSTQICVGSNRVYITVSSCASSRIYREYEEDMSHDPT